MVEDSKLYNNQHSHSVDLHTIRASARRLICYEKEMSEVEIAFVMELGPARLGATKARDIMRLKFPDRDYNGPLLHGLLAKGAQKHFGSDPDSMAEFMSVVDNI